MPQIQIPTIGSIIELEKDWEFHLFAEYRNKTLWRAITGGHRGCEYWPFMYRPEKYIKVKLPAATKLRVARLYIRNGVSEYDSVTFTIKDCPNKNMKGRFWAKLGDVNNIVGNWADETIPKELSERASKAIEVTAEQIKYDIENSMDHYRVNSTDLYPHLP